ncbi:MAG: hypothetical protein GC202_02180 [Alphaproteobacteria bacterium]|nr:hypothetical protein [Alphaproteobacteria bacterium]
MENIGHNGLEVRLAGWAVGAFKIVAIVVLTGVAFMLAGLLLDGSLLRQPGAFLLAAVGIVFTMLLGLGGFFILAAIWRTLERIEIRLARAAESQGPR